MACFTPLQAYTTYNGGITFNQNEGIVPQKLNCGQCIGCRLDRALMWAVRITHENQMHENSCFITLTYNDENLPHDHSLAKPHFQKFLKKLRYHCSDRKINPESGRLKRYWKKIKYYQVGEYGKLGRPHYHAIIFNHDWDDKIQVNTKKSPEYTSKTLTKLWGKGNATTGTVTPQSAAYCARYCIKKITGDKAHDHYIHTSQETGEIFQLEPEYTTMSLKPAIGLDWYKKFHSDIHPHDNCIHKGRKVKTPRYYEAQLEKINPDLLAEIKEKRKEYAFKHRKDSTPNRLATRLKCAELNLKRNTSRDL